ncbi:glycosyl hydrolase family 8 [Nitrospirillum sp. BR 11828]|uniref:glycosyl hydrolase family 8 n=1 Tax=Nitrospirillum sp. BR 11828 TaxID=3104325 RepID=UPI002ACA084F|nr:glycosyl hydrolase family 8 [Nitrospirillum sp. BR 11828]MDZ5650791.1 glycosyl hydrolase family 8 [Nitrospirillum sp. BR 11828]
MKFDRSSLYLDSNNAFIGNIVNMFIDRIINRGGVVLSRRGIVAGLAGIAAVYPVWAMDEPFGAAWTAYRRRFVRATGRVVDTGNHGISHSEGQGTGLLFALAADDRDSFAAIWEWTRANLRRDDGLLAWRWLPNVSVPVPDRNNATDGDLLTAWALARAARRWTSPDYREAALHMAAAIREKLLVAGGRAAAPLLLPGIQGFQHEDGLTLNLSYYVFPAFQELAALERMAAVPGADQTWQAVASGGLDLIRGARFGAHSLPPDWLRRRQDGELAPDPRFPPRFGYDAVRIPLYLALAGLLTPDLAAPFRALWLNAPPPGWVDLVTGAVAPYTEHGGYLSVAKLIVAGAAPARELTAEDDYFSASLTLLAQLPLG